MPGTPIKVDKLNNFTRSPDEEMARHLNTMQVLESRQTGVEPTKEKFLNFIATILTRRQRNAMHYNQADFC